jgi:hypothetical protein
MTTLKLYIAAFAVLKIQGSIVEVRSSLCKKQIIRATYKILTVTALISAQVVTAEPIKNENNNIVFLVPGFLIDAEFYTSYLDLLKPSKSFVFPSNINNKTLMEEASSLAIEIKNQVTKENIILLGHSRGAAVVSVASCLLSQESFIHRLYTILLDPVDSNDLVAQSSIQNCKVPFKAPLIVSTPYGGSSTYYNVTYTNACSPNGRNADAFYQAYHNQSSLSRHACDNLLYVTIPSAGHLQLLDAGLTTSAVCATGKLPNEVVRSFINTLVVSWYSIMSAKSTSQQKSIADQRKHLEILEYQLTKLFPNISNWIY